MLAESYLHTLSPFLLRISGEIGLRWYGLAYLAGFVVAGHIMGKLVKTGEKPTGPTKDRSGFFTDSTRCWSHRWGTPWICPFLSTSSSLDLWFILSVLGTACHSQRGMASHGGMLGVLVASAYFVQKNKLDLYDTLHVADLAAFVQHPASSLAASPIL